MTLRDRATADPVRERRAGRWAAATRSRQVRSVVVACIVVVAVVVVARWLREVPRVAEFVERHPGSTPLPASAPVGIPPWLAWQHAINALFLLLVVRAGLTFRRTPRPTAYVTPKSRRQKVGKAPQRISIDLWLHLVVDTLLVVNGLVFYVLLFATGQWMRIVPNSWAVVPDALSSALQYASLDWPSENGWISYNGLQLLTYFAVVFVLAPAALLTGLRMSPSSIGRSGVISRLLPIEVARRRHWQIMLAFVAFVVVHVVLVLATGARNNLNHMYAARDDESWTGTVIFLGSVVVMVSAVAALRPVVVRALASTMGKVGR